MSAVCSNEGCGVAPEVKGKCRRHYGQAHYAANRENIRRKHREHYEANRDSTLEQHRKWREANPEYDREYHADHRQSKSRYSHEWRKDNPEIGRANAARRRQRKDICMTAQDRRESVAWRKIIKDRPCAYCGEFSDVMHDDHVKPLARGGTDHWFNLVRACAPCNLRKHTKTVFEFSEINTNT